MIFIWSEIYGEEKKWEGLNSKNLSASSLDSSLIGPTLPPISSFTLPTGASGEQVRQAQRE